MPIVEGLRMLHHMTGHTHLQSVQSLQLTSTMVFMKNFSSTILVITTAYSDRPGNWVECEIGDVKEPKGLRRGASVADIDGDGCLELLK
jgi:hypothetical protein